MKDTRRYKDKHNDNTRSKRRPFKKDKRNVYFSVVIPVYNEKDSLPELAIHLDRELKKIPNVTENNYEIIFVDDGSTDNSFEVIKTIKRRNPRVRGYRFRRNYGKSAALTVGFSRARGNLIGTMDADLQDDPASFRNMIDKINEGYDLVSGWKKKRKDPLGKTLPSKFFNLVTSIVSGIRLHDFNCGIKVYRREVVKSLHIYGEIYRYIPALAKWEGFRVTEIPVVHHSRRYGKSKYGVTRLIKGFLDLITVVFTTRYLRRPLHFFGTLGAAFALIGFAIDLYLTIEWFLGNTYLTNRPLALFGIALIIVGVQLISMGLIGEMIVKRRYEKDDYNIKEKI